MILWKATTSHGFQVTQTHNMLAVWTRHCSAFLPFAAPASRPSPASLDIDSSLVLAEVILMIIPPRVGYQVNKGLLMV